MKKTTNLPDFFLLIQNALLNEWPHQKDSQQIILFIQQSFISHFPSKNMTDYYKSVKKIKEFINSSRFVSLFKNQKISKKIPLLNEKISYVSRSIDFQELNAGLDYILATLEKLPDVDRSANIEESVSAKKIKGNNLSSSYASVLIPMLAFSSHVIGAAAEKKDPTETHLVTNDIPMNALDETHLPHITPKAISNIFPYDSSQKMPQKNNKLMLHEAIANGVSIKELTKIIEQAKTIDGFNIDENDSQTLETPLHIACDMGDMAAVELLLKQGANVNAQTRDGVTCLHIAAGKNDIQLVKILLAHNANSNLLTKALGHRTAITSYQVAITNNHLDCAKLILEYQKKYKLDPNVLPKVKQAIDLFKNGKANEALELYIEAEQLISAIQDKLSITLPLKASDRATDPTYIEYEKLVEYQDLVGLIRFNMAGIYESKKDYSKTLEHLITAENFALPRVEIYAALCDRLVESFNNQDTLALTLAYVEKGLKRFPESVTLLSIQANILHSAGRYDEAYSITEKIKIYAPEYAENYYIRGNCELHRGKYEKSLIEYKRAFALQPKEEKYQEAIKVTKSILAFPTLAICQDQTKSQALNLSKLYQAPFKKITDFQKQFYCGVPQNGLIADNCHFAGDKNEINQLWRDTLNLRHKEEYQKALDINFLILKKFPADDPYYNTQISALTLEISRIYFQLENNEAAKKYLEINFALSVIDLPYAYSFYSAISALEQNIEASLISAYKAHQLEPEDETLKEIYEQVYQALFDGGHNPKAIISQWQKNIQKSQAPTKSTIQYLIEQAKEFITENTLSIAVSGGALFASLSMLVLNKVSASHRQKYLEREHQRQTKLSMLRLDLSQLSAGLFETDWEVQKPNFVLLDCSRPILKQEQYSLTKEALLDALIKQLKTSYGERNVQKSDDKLKVRLPFNYDFMNEEYNQKFSQVKKEFRENLYQCSEEYKEIILKKTIEKLRKKLSDLKVKLEPTYKHLEEKNKELQNLDTDLEATKQLKNKLKAAYCDELKTTFDEQVTAYEKAKQVYIKFIEEIKKEIAYELRAIDEIEKQEINKDNYNEVEKKVTQQDASLQSFVVEFFKRVDKAYQVLQETYDKPTKTYTKLSTEYESELQKVALIEKARKKQQKEARRSQEEEEKKRAKEEKLKQQRKQQLEQRKKALAAKKAADTAVEKEKKVTTEKTSPQKQESVEHYCDYTQSSYFKMGHHSLTLIENFLSKNNDLNLKDPIEKRIYCEGLKFNIRKLAHATGILLSGRMKKNLCQLRDNLMHFSYLLRDKTEEVTEIAKEISHYVAGLYVWNHKKKQEITEPLYLKKSSIMAEMNINDKVRPIRIEYIQACMLQITEFATMLDVLINAQRNDQLTQYQETHLHNTAKTLFRLISNMQNSLPREIQLGIREIYAKSKKIKSFTSETALQIQNLTADLFKLLSTSSALCDTNTNLDNCLLNNMLNHTQQSDTNLYQHLKNLASQSANYHSISTQYADVIIHQDILPALENLVSYYDYFLKLVPEPSFYDKYDQHGMFHSAIKETIVKIGQALRDLPHDPRLELLKLIQKHKAFWNKVYDKSTFEYYRDKIGHDFEAKDEEQKRQQNKPDVFEEVIPPQLLDMMKHANALLTEFKLYLKATTTEIKNENNEALSNLNPSEQNLASKLQVTNPKKPMSAEAPEFKPFSSASSVKTVFNNLAMKGNPQHPEDSKPHITYNNRA